MSCESALDRGERAMSTAICLTNALGVERRGGGGAQSADPPGPSATAHCKPAPKPMRCNRVTACARMPPGPGAWRIVLAAPRVRGLELLESSSSRPGASATTCTWLLAPAPAS
eukprot:6524767-Prymnesium_polylepis.2